MLPRRGIYDGSIAFALDNWLAKPTIRVAHQRRSRASADALWSAAREVQLRETQVLGRLVRWRIPGIPGELAFDELFRRPPFLVLEEGERSLLSGLVGRIWTLRRDYPDLSGPEEYVEWSARGTARVLFATWAEALPNGARLCSEVRVEAIGAQGRIGLSTVRPLVRGFNHLIGTDGIAAAVRAAEREDRGTRPGRGQRGDRAERGGKKQSPGDRGSVPSPTESGG